VKRLWLALALLPGCTSQLASTEACDGDCNDATPQAICQAEVDGKGVVAVEEIYVPQVIACENRNAPPAAMRAQAIAVRSFLYQTLDVAGKIGDGTNAQVFSCTDSATGQPVVPNEDHKAAAAATAGQILMHQGHLVAGFFAAGAQQVGPTCTGGTSDPTSTEYAITYNQGKRGADVSPSALGHAENPANRGAMSQNGANCLADNAWTTDQILRFYYGEDIEVVQTAGECTAASAQVNAEDIGEACSDDSSCDAVCLKWYLETINQSFGMCSAECDGACPEGSACIEAHRGAQRCAPLPAADNSFCDAIPGTVPRVLQAESLGFVSVCASPALGTACQGSSKGECVDTSVPDACEGGVLEQGVCPGGNAIQCCIR